MAAREITGFATEEAATAFADGVSYVNDSAIADIEVAPSTDGNGFSVLFTDQDAEEDEVLAYDPGQM
jgi:hypothetical protein